MFYRNNIYCILLSLILILSACFFKKAGADLTEIKLNFKKSLSDGISTNDDIFNIYNAKKITPFTDFDFDNYCFLVKLTEKYINKEEPLFTYAILGKGIKSIDEGKKIYNILNNSYLIRTPDFTYQYKNDELQKKEVDDFLYNSHIISISEDGKTFLRLIFKKTSESQTMYQQFNWIYEVLKENKTIFTYKQQGMKSEKNFDIFGNFSGYFITDHYKPIFYSYFQQGKELPLKNSKEIIYNINYKATANGKQYLLSDYTEKGHEIIIFSTENNKELGRYSLSSKTNSYVEQFISYNQILYSESDHLETKNIEQAVYLFDRSEEFSYLVGKFIFNPCISPDQKFLAYHTPNKYEFSDENFSNKYGGIYVFNFEKEEEFIYPLNTNSNDVEIICWFLADKLDEILVKK